MRGEPFTGSNFKSDQPTRLKESAADERAAEKAWLALCRYVDGRDFGCCRVCGKRTMKTLCRVASRAEHHHVIPRSLGGEETRENIALACLACHEERHITRVLSIRGNAEGRLYFEKGGRKWRG